MVGRRTHILLFVSLALLWTAPVLAQLPPLPGLGGEEEGGAGLKVQIASSEPREVVQRLKQQLLERQQALIAAAPDLDTWQKERKRFLQRLEQARARLESLQGEIATEEEESRAWREREAARQRALDEWARLAAERARRAAELADARTADAGPVGTPDGGTAADGRGPSDTASPAADGPTDVVAPEDTRGDAAAPEDGRGDVVAPEDGQGGGAADADGSPSPAIRAAAELPLPELSDPGPAPELTYPGYRLELERYVRLLEVATEELHYLVAGLAEERELVASGIDKADQILARFEEPRDRARVDGGPPGFVPLAQARSVSYDLYLAGLELSLARSREGSFDQDREEPEETRDIEALLTPPPPLDVPEDPTDRTQETWQAARQLRDEGNDVVTRLGQLIQIRKDRTDELVQTRLRVARVDVRAKEQRADELTAQLDDALDRIRITPQDLETEKARLASLSGKIAADIERVQSDLERLRAEPVPDGSASDADFSPGFLRELRLAALQEELTFHELRRERMQFVYETTEELQRMLRGEAPGSRYMRRFDRILTRREQARRLEEIGQRHEAWRRQHMQLQQKPAPVGFEKGRKQSLGLLLKLVELCAKQEDTVESEGRLADIVRYHLKRYEARARSTWWYLWRGFLTLVLLALAVVASRVLGRGSLRVARAAGATREKWRAKLVEAVEGKAPREWRDGALRAARSLAFGLYLGGLVVIWLGGAVVALQVVWGIGLGLARIGEILAAPLFLVGDSQITLGAVGKLVLTILLAVLGARVVQTFLERQVFQFFEWDQGVRHAVSVVLRYLVLFIGVSLGLEYIGLGLGAFAVLLGVVGIGIGFGLQNIANNFISGFIILFERPVKKGDFVETGELEGEVQAISARATTVLTRDNVSVIIPNSEFVSGRVVNWSHDDRRIRLRVPVGVAYGSDVKKVERILLRLAKEHREILSRPQPEVQFSSFGDSALNLTLLAWTRNVRDRFRIVSDLNKALDDAFRAAGVSIPFPQRDLHIKSGFLPAPPDDTEEGQPR